MLTKIESLLQNAVTDEDLAAITNFSSDFEHWLVADQLNDAPRAKGIHASEASGCLRRAVYSLNGTAPRQESDGRWRKRLMIGHAVHGMLQNMFVKMAADSKGRLEFEAEVKIAPETNVVAAAWEIESSCDGIFTMRDADGVVQQRLGLEIKSMAPDEFSKLTAPKPEHIAQAHVYMACLDLPMMWFLYWNKGNQNYTGTNLQPFVVRYNPELWTSITERFELMHEWAFKKELPPREVSVLCEFCSYSYTCNPPKGTGNRTIPDKWKKR